MEKKIRVKPKAFGAKPLSNLLLEACLRNAVLGLLRLGLLGVLQMLGSRGEPSLGLGFRSPKLSLMGLGSRVLGFRVQGFRV